jgi:hypothetical protein
MDEKKEVPIEKDAGRKIDPEQVSKYSFVKVAGVLSSVAAIFALGYGIGQFKQGMDFKLEKMEIKQECAEKLQTAINGCRDAKLSEYEGTVSDFKSFMKEFKEKDEKK